MNTKDLMIGDILSYDNKPYKVDAINVLGEVLVEDHVKGHWDSVCIYREEDVHPIKLSIEMLLDNGFIFDEIDESFSISNNEGRCIKLYKESGSNEFWLDGYYGSITFSSVHELQHLLRLCGLRDLANNFKVD